MSPFLYLNVKLHKFMIKYIGYIKLYINLYLNYEKKVLIYRNNV